MFGVLALADDQTTKTNPKRPKATSEAGRRFYQRRVALFGFVGAGLGAVFLVFRVLTLALTGSFNAIAHPSMLLHLAGVGSMLMGWALCRGARRNKRFVEITEVLSLIVSSIAYSAMGAFIPPSVRPEMVTILAMTMAVIARAIFVPSTPKRTAVLTSAVGLPIIALGYLAHAIGDDPMAARLNELYPPIAVAISTAVWWLLTVTLATVTSQVIYGLRKEISEARKLGQYNLESKLGEGGMGVVYRASHAMLRRPTAIKLLPQTKAGEHAIARFEREVRLTARLTHPNTVTVFDYGRTPDGIFYYAMELLEGATLEEIVDIDGPQPAARVLHMLASTAGALAEAHEIGLIHRDIKPANVMMCRRGGEVDVPKLLDFGLVKDLEASQTLSLTTTNTITGTPLYMPPEAIIAPHKVDARSDIYALGAVGYFMLTGTNVFEGDSVVEVCSRHLHGKPEHPAERLGVALPDDLTSLLLQCLAKKQEERPSSASELQALLLSCGDAHAWSPRQAKRWWQTHGSEVLGKRSAMGGSGSEATIEVDLGRRTDRPPAR